MEQPPGPAPEPGASPEPRGPTPEPASERPEPGGGVRRALLVGIVALLVLVGGAAVALVSALSGSDEALLSKVPGDVHVFASIYLDPGADQKLNLRRIAGEFPALGGPQGLDERLGEVLDEAVGGFGLDWQDDVGPWLGSQVGFALRATQDAEPAVGVLVDAEDERAAGRALAEVHADGRTTEREHRGVTITVGPGPGGQDLATALVDGAVVLSNDPALVESVIDASAGAVDRLVDSADYRASLESLPESRLLVGFVDLRGLVEASGVREELEAGMLPGAGLDGAAGFEQIEALRGMGFTVSAEAEGIAARAAVVVDEERLPEDQRALLEQEPNLEAVLGGVPEDALFVLAASGAEIPSEAVEQLDQLSGFFGVPSPRAMLQSLTGDAAVQVGPSGFAVGGALLLGIDDPAAVRGFLDELADAIAAGTLGPQGLGPGFLEPGFLEPEPGGLIEEGIVPLAMHRNDFGTWETEEHRGVTIRYLRAPDLRASGVTPAYAVTDELAILATAPTEAKQVLDALAGEGSIRESDRFRQATERVGTDVSQLLFLDVDGMLRAFGAGMPPADRENIEPVRSVASSARSGVPTTTIRVFVVVG